MNKRWLHGLIPAVLAAVTLTGCNTASAATPANSMSKASNMQGSSNTTNSNAGAGSENSAAMGSTASTMSNTTASSNSSMGKSQASIAKLHTSDILVGAAASAPMGPGNGEFLMASVGQGKLIRIPLASGANGFKVAISGNTAYVPTLQGQTYVVNLQSHMITGQFATPSGARIANLGNNGRLLVITGAKSVTAYSLPSHTMAWQLKAGGNALAIAGRTAYLSGNSMGHTDIIDLASGKVTGTIPVGHIEDSVYDRQTHTLWLADWTNGDMTVVNTQNDKVVATIHRAEGGGFSMQNMMSSTGGFMQVTVGPNGKYVYAASFSGNIMVYNAKMNTFAKDITVGTTAKLSGIAIDPSDKYIYTTVENKQETVAVSVATGKAVWTLPGVMANRWTVIHD